MVDGLSHDKIFLSGVSTSASQPGSRRERQPTFLALFKPETSNFQSHIIGSTPDRSGIILNALNGHEVEDAAIPTSNGIYKLLSVEDFVSPPVVTDRIYKDIVVVDKKNELYLVVECKGKNAGKIKLVKIDNANMDQEEVVATRPKSKSLVGRLKRMSVSAVKSADARYDNLEDCINKTGYGLFRKDNGLYIADARGNLNQQVQYQNTALQEKALTFRKVGLFEEYQPVEGSFVITDKDKIYVAVNNPDTGVMDYISFGNSGAKNKKRDNLTIVSEFTPNLSSEFSQNVMQNHIQTIKTFSQKNAAILSKEKSLFASFNLLERDFWENDAFKFFTYRTAVVEFAVEKSIVPVTSSWDFFTQSLINAHFEVIGGKIIDNEKRALSRILNVQTQPLSQTIVGEKLQGRISCLRDSPVANLFINTLNELPEALKVRTTGMKEKEFLSVLKALTIDASPKVEEVSGGALEISELNQANPGFESEDALGELPPIPTFATTPPTSPRSPSASRESLLESVDKGR